MSFFRYPGGKTKLLSKITDALLLESSFLPCGYEYREPFFGGGGIGIPFCDVARPSKMWVNDRDEGIAALWTALLCSPEAFKQRVLNFVPSVEVFDLFTDNLKTRCPDWRSNESIVDFGFMKLVVHQLSYSGLGLRSGGPLGGRKQSSPYKIDCRWSPEYICKKIDKTRSSLLAGTIRGNKCWFSDFQNIIENEDGPALLYIDPPYYHKGNDLYFVGFSKEDHIRLAEALKKTSHRWVLSYDACEEIQTLYSWAKIEQVIVNYSITATGKTEKKSRWKYEYLISRPA